MIQLNAQTLAYAEGMSTPQLPWLAHVAGQTQQHGLAKMMSSSSQVNLLALLVALSQAKSVLELGTFTGYASLAMASRLPVDGHLYTVEKNAAHAAIAKHHFKHSPLNHKITLVQDDALSFLRTTTCCFDFSYIDADKKRYPQYFAHIFERTIAGGLIVLDNMLYRGEVCAPESSNAKILAELNAELACDNRLEVTFLPMRDGLSVVRKI